MASDSFPNFEEWKNVIEGYQESAQKKEKEMEERAKQLNEKEVEMKKYLEEQEKEMKGMQERAKQLDEKEAGMKKYLEEQEKEMKQRLEEVEEMGTTLAEEKRGWEEEKERVKKTKTFEKIVTLNIGGCRYTTTLSTLTKYPDSLLGAMFRGRHALVQQEDGSYFIDRDGESFRYILMYLRDDRLARVIIPKLDTKLQLHLAYDAEYFQLPELAKVSKVFGNAVTLNVGGSRYTTTLSTLTKYPDSMLGAMFSGRHALVQQEDGSYFIDVDGKPFRYVLSYLRDREHGIDTLSLLGEDDLGDIMYLGKYFQLQELETLALVRKNNKKGLKALTLNVANIREDPRYDAYSGITNYATTSHTHNVEYSVDKEENILTCTTICTKSYNRVQISGPNYEYTDFTGSFKQCNMSGLQFVNCYFGKGVSFEGTILHNTVFQHCSGLVSNKVHFAPWQVAQAKFQPELLEALKSNGCVY